MVKAEKQMHAKLHERRSVRNTNCVIELLHVKFEFLRLQLGHPKSMTKYFAQSCPITSFKESEGNHCQTLDGYGSKLGTPIIGWLIVNQTRLTSVVPQVFHFDPHPDDTLPIWLCPTNENAQNHFPILMASSWVIRHWTQPNHRQSWIPCIAFSWLVRVCIYIRTLKQCKYIYIGALNQTNL